METVRLPPAVAAEIRRLAQQSPTEEVCGLVSGDASGATGCHPVRNIAADKSRFFELDPRGQIDALRTMRERGEQLVGIYHSHPTGPPAPSPTDVERHEYPDAIYFIVSLGAAPELRAFRIRDRRVSEIAIEPSPLDVYRHL